jgi:hypothetical protein
MSVDVDFISDKTSGNTRLKVKFSDYSGNPGGIVVLDSSDEFCVKESDGEILVNGETA